MNTRLSQREHPSRRSGLAMIVVVALLSMVGLAVILLASVTRAEMAHTRHVTAQAQLRQLLLAGEHVAAAQLAQHDHTAQERTVELPAWFDEGATLRLHIDPTTEGVRRVQVRASTGRQSAAQELAYRQVDGQWVLVGATRIGSGVLPDS